MIDACAARGGPGVNPQYNIDNGRECVPKIGRELTKDMSHRADKIGRKVRTG